MISDEEQTALQHARNMAANGVPLFIARPHLDADGTWIPDGGHHGSGYWLPKQWQLSEPSVDVVDRWQPGDALCAVMGHSLDLLDVDPRSGGDESLERLRRAGAVPVAYAEAATPSGGSHFFISPLGVRSVDRLLPGIDIKAGTADGKGRGFAFIAPTVKLSKMSGELVPYCWQVDPDMDLLLLVGGDDSGDKIAQLIESKTPATEGYTGPTYDGPPYEELEPEDKQRAQEYLEAEKLKWGERLAEAAEWPEGQTDDRDRGWEGLTKDAAWALAMLGFTPWVPLTIDEAQDAFEELVPDVIAADPKCQNKWSKGLLERASHTPAKPPWWQDFVLPALGTAASQRSPEDYPAFPAEQNDSYMAEWIMVKALNLDWCYVPRSLGWMHWNGRVWAQSSEEETREVIRDTVLSVCEAAARNTTLSRAQVNAFLALRSNGRIGGLAQLSRGINTVSAGGFDQQPDLLNVANGIVDLRTGDLLPHDRKWHLTKITETNYIPTAKHDDWEQCLQAFDPEVAEWMRYRIGQGITGYLVSDDIIPIGQGSGSNGKSTFLTALRAALGEHMTKMPDKLLSASLNDHPTELTDLFGTRLAYIDETPEAAQLNVQRLKAIAGQERMKARRVHKDNMEWRSTHSLLVMTNYVPVVHETDHGTWRRLSLIRFTKTFKRDDAFRSRVARGGSVFREAVLAWAVTGSIDWYKNQRTIPAAPERVENDTREWRMDTDLVLRFITDHLVFDHTSCVVSRDLLETLNAWLLDRQQRPWGDRLMAARFLNHEEIQNHKVTKAQAGGALPAALTLSRPRDAFAELPDRPVLWHGLRWRTDHDDDNKEATTT